MNTELPKVDAQVAFSIEVDCPFCEKTNDITNTNIRENLRHGLSVRDCEYEMDCKFCNAEFIVENINY